MLRLRVRLPLGKQITGVALGGRKFDRYEPRSGTLDLSGLKGRLKLVVSYA
jgi:hypothetical protein